MNGWVEQAACRDHPDAVDAFGDEQCQRRFAIHVCEPCPVREPCADHALRTRETEGVWGGMTSEQLRTALRRRASA